MIILKNPNGYGSICKLSGKRRKPYAAIKTVGWDDNGHQIRHTIGYYETRSKAMQALAEFNTSPFDLANAGLTFAELFERISAKKFEKISQSSINGYNAAFKISEPLHSIKFSDIKTAHLQNVIDECDKGHATRRKLRVLFNQLYKYALENDIVTKDYSKFIDIGENDEASTRKPFSDAEIKLLWDNLGRMDYIDTILIMIYSGLRPGELVTIENANVNLDERTMRGGIKTKAGKNRLIPINKKILPFIEKRFHAGNRYLVSNEKGNPFSYDVYYKWRFAPIMEQLGLKHKPHDARHTFATLMDNAGANKVAIKRIMGHASQDITDKVYTHKDITELLKAIDLI